MTHKAPGTIKRTSGIGGSDIAAICGLSKYRTAYQVYLEKRGELITDMDDTTRLRFGRRFEKPIADEFSFVTGRKIKSERVTQRHPDHKFLLANIDRWQVREDGVRGVYEGKTADWTQRHLWINGGVPESYYLQLQWYLMVTGSTFGSFGVLFGLGDFHFFDVDRDDQVIANIQELGVDFWQRVKTGNPPDFMFGKAGNDLVKRMYEQSIPGTRKVFDTVETEVKIRRLLQLKAAVKSRETELNDLEGWLKLQMGEAETAICPGLAKITWKTSERKALNAEALRENFPEIAVQCTEMKSSRRFSITAMKPDEIEIDTTPDQPFTITKGVRMIEFD